MGFVRGSDVERRFPGIADMEATAKGRTPRFAYDYMTGGIGRGVCLARNREALDGVTLVPRYIDGAAAPDMGATLLGQTYGAPFGVAPIGLGGLIWPRAAVHLAAAAVAHKIPFALSTFATTSIETIGSIAGRHGWFQLYTPNDQAVADELLERAAAAGFATLVVTIDIPATTPREHDTRNGLSVPPRFDVMTALQVAACPAWALATLAAGIPRFETLLPYVPKGMGLDDASRFLTDLVAGPMTREILARIRGRWSGKMIVKGVLDPADAVGCRDIGADGIVISNHGGRQSDAAPSPLEVMAGIRDAVGDDLAIIADGGVKSGVDIARMLASGGDFVLLGRAFMIAMAALGKPGADYAMTLLKGELRRAMIQVGCASVARLCEHLRK
ncbi:MAG: alpha-hydroxy acid oxidase [Alphaproteobacteria bacterium]